MKGEEGWEEQRRKERKTNKDMKTELKWRNKETEPDGAGVALPIAVLIDSTTASSTEKVIWVIPTVDSRPKKDCLCISTHELSVTRDSCRRTAAIQKDKSHSFNVKQTE